MFCLCCGSHCCTAVNDSAWNQKIDQSQAGSHTQNKWKEIHQLVRIICRAVTFLMCLHTIHFRKYIWRTYCLMLDGQRLTDDSAVVSQLGIKQGTVLKFSRMPHEKGTHRKAWRWYRKWMSRWQIAINIERSFAKKHELALLPNAATSLSASEIQLLPQYSPGWENLPATASICQQLAEEICDACL